jgi:putative flavoprotein involved in K+ transport
MPRRYRGLDIQHWLDMLGTLDRRYDSFGDLAAARRAPSLQLVGSPDGSSLDLSSLQADGVRLVGRLAGADGSKIRLDRGLRSAVAEADEAQARLLDRIDLWATEHSLDCEVETPHRPRPVEISDEPHTLELERAGIRTVLWATGYRPDYSWIDHELLDATGAVAHDGGIATTVPDLYFMGLPLMRTRKSTYIDGVGADAAALSGDMVGRLGNASRVTAGSVPSGPTALGK